MSSTTVETTYPTSLSLSSETSSTIPTPPTTTTTTMANTTTSGSGFPRDLIESIRLNWNVMTLTVVNTCLLVINLLLVLVLIYCVFANSRKVIRFVKNYVRFYSQILNPPERFVDMVESSPLDTGKSEPASCSSSSTTNSGRSHTNLSNYSTSESIHNERPQRARASRLCKPLSIALAPRGAVSSTAIASSNSAAYTKSSSNGNGSTSGGRVSSYFLKSKIERARNNNNNDEMERKRAAAMERETSSESLKVKMKRSESWDAKNNIYLNSSYLCAKLTTAENATSSNSNKQPSSSRTRTGPTSAAPTTYNFDF